MAYQDSTIGFMYESYPFISTDRFQGQLKGKVAVVTGGSSGIGRAACKSFAAAGASVACIARREPLLNTLVDEIKAAGGHAIPVVADITAPGAAKNIISKVEAELGPVDILVNNAGISRISPVYDEPEDLDVWWKVYEVNVRAPVALIRQVLPGMMERKSGMVVSVSSVVSTWCSPVMTAYSSSKAAISKFHETLVPELEGSGVLSFSLFPGLVESDLGNPEDAVNKQSNHPFVQKFLQMTKTQRKKQTAAVPGDTLVALACEPRCKALNGRVVDAAQDLEAVVNEIEKEGGGRIGKEKMYTVNIGIL